MHRSISQNRCVSGARPVYCRLYEADLWLRIPTALVVHFHVFFPGSMYLYISSGTWHNTFSIEGDLLSIFVLPLLMTASALSQYLRIDRHEHQTRASSTNCNQQPLRTRHRLAVIWGSYEWTAPGSRLLIFLSTEPIRVVMVNNPIPSVRSSIFSISTALQARNRVYYGHMEVNNTPSISGVWFCIVPTTQNREWCPEDDLLLFPAPTDFQILEWGWRIIMIEFYFYYFIYLFFTL